MKSLTDVMEDSLKDLYSAENQLLKSLPKVLKKASSDDLKMALEAHMAETQEQVARLQKIGKILGIDMGGKKCLAMEGLVKEAAEVLEEEGPGPVIDCALVGAARRVEHYEIAAYSSTLGMAMQLGNEDVAALLQETMDEETAADEKLMTLCVDGLYAEADREDGEKSGKGSKSDATKKNGDDAKTKTKAKSGAMVAEAGRARSN